MGDIPEEFDVHYNASTEDSEGSNDQHGLDVQLIIRVWKQTASLL